MLIRINGTEIIGVTEISSQEQEDKFLVTHPSYIKISNFKFTESIDLYEYVNDTIQLISGWEAIKDARVEAARVAALPGLISSAQDKVDADCKEYIYSYWSKEAQSNVALGIYTQTIADLCKTEIGLVLAQNVTFIEDIALLTSQEDINLYVTNIVRATITGGN